MPPKGGDEEPVGFPWSLLDLDDLATRRGRLRLVLFVAACALVIAVLVAIHVFGHPDLATALVIGALLIAATWWVLNGEKGDSRRKLPRASYGGIDFPARAADWREARLCSQLAAREVLLAAEREKADPDVLWIAELVGSVNALCWALCEPTRAKLTEQERAAVARFVPIGGAR